MARTPAAHLESLGAATETRDNMNGSPTNKAKVPIYQRIIQWVMFTISGAFVVASALDTFSSAIEIVTPLMRVVGTAILVLGWIALHVILRFHSINWVAREGQQIRIKNLGPGINLGLVGILLLLWAPTLAKSLSFPVSSSTNVTVQADKDWQGSGIEVEQGQQFTISYKSGSWTINVNNPGSIDPYTDAGGNPKITFDLYVSNAPIGALIARIDEGQPFLVSRFIQLEADTNGELFFRMNDGICTQCSSSYADNDGELLVEVQLGTK